MILLWCLGGDFNVVKSPDEKNEVTLNQLALSQFLNFIENARLVDLPLLEGKFTWCNNRLEPTFCRLDRFLLLIEFVVKMSSLMEKVLLRSLLDHNHVYLIKDVVNWGPKPFRFFNYWLDGDGF